MQERQEKNLYTDDPIKKNLGKKSSNYKVMHFHIQKFFFKLLKIDLPNV